MTEGKKYKSMSQIMEDAKKQMEEANRVSDRISNRRMAVEVCSKFVTSQDGHWIDTLITKSRQLEKYLNFDEEADSGQ